MLVANSSNTTTLHLSVQRFGLDIAHKHYNLQRFDISTCGNKCNGYCYAEIFIIAELTNQLITVASRVCNLLYKLVICSTENLLCNLHDIACVGIIESKYQCLWQIIHIWLTLRICKHLGIYSITIGFKNEFYLSRIHDASIQLRLGIGCFVLILDVLNSTCVTGNLLYILTLTNSSAILCCLSLDSIYSIINIYAISNRFLQCVVYNAIVIEECQCFRCRGCSKTYHLCAAEIVQDLTPIAIDRTVALINDNHIEEIWRQCKVCRQSNLIHLVCSVILIVISIIYLLTFQQREQTLNSTNYNIAI